MKLHENKSLFTEAIRVTAQQRKLPEIFVEKDYWVMLALQTIYSNEIGKEVIFKGGTALSKCFGLIERFSEDIDLVLLKAEDQNPTQFKKKLKQITTIVSSAIPEVKTEGITHKMGTIRKTAHQFDKVFTKGYGHVRDVIVVEATWLGHHEPYLKKVVSSYIYDMMANTGQIEMAKTFNLLPFEVLVLDVKRTLCEKIMSLARFSHTENPISDLGNKIRHTYDIHKILSNTDLNDFFYSNQFDELLLKVANDDVTSFKNNNNWLQFHPKEALIFKNPTKIWDQIKSNYNNSFKALVFGLLPPDTEILERIIEVSKRLETIEWTINPNSESN
nr:nucleotidyl transferase AbiEii/AbiGii toxin family protein [uncultured Marinifilum sp.]